VLTPRAALFLVGSGLLGLAVSFDRGRYTGAAITCVALALAALGICFAQALSPAAGREEDARPLAALVWLALVGLCCRALTDPAPLLYAERPWLGGRVAQLGSLVLLASYLPGLFGSFREGGRLVRLRFIAFLLLTAIAGLDALRASPHPRIDVWAVQMDGAAALLHGSNPYTSVAVHDTGPGTLVDAVPYVYPPTQLYLTLLSRALGDVRLTMLAAVLAAAVAMRLVAGDRRPAFAKDAPALFLLLTPKLPFVLEQSWVDPVQVMLLSTGLALATRARRDAAAVVLGLAVSSKQTMFWMLPLAGFCLRFDRRAWLLILLAAVAPVVPFAFWNARALIHANFDVLNGLPLRSDALTINNWALRTWQLEIPGAVGFVLAAGAVAVACWKLRGPGPFGLAAATTYLVFFAFNRWAFANYYFLVAGLAALAAAGDLGGEGDAATVAAHDSRLERQLAARGGAPAAAGPTPGAGHFTAADGEGEPRP
jgi:hypothetical protein